MVEALRALRDGGSRRIHPAPARAVRVAVLAGEGNYPPAEPGVLVIEPLEAAVWVADATTLA